MKINIITQTEFDQLTEICANYPVLTLQNKGYEGIDKSKFNEAEKIAFDNVNDILKKSICGFSKFQNFRKSNKTGQTELRFQYNYNYEGAGLTFIGVGYILLDELLNGFN